MAQIMKYQGIEIIDMINTEYLIKSNSPKMIKINGEERKRKKKEAKHQINTRSKQKRKSEENNKKKERNEPKKEIEMDEDDTIDEVEEYQKMENGNVVKEIVGILKEMEDKVNESGMKLYANRIINNLKRYGRSVKEWKEIGFLLFDNEKQNMVEMIETKYPENEINKSITNYSIIKQVHDKLKHGENIFDRQYLIENIKTKWSIATDIALIEEIYLRGNEQYLEYLNNPIISYQVTTLCEIQSLEYKIQSIQLRIKYIIDWLTLKFNL